MSIKQFVFKIESCILLDHFVYNIFFHIEKDWCLV